MNSYHFWTFRSQPSSFDVIRITLMPMPARFLFTLRLLDFCRYVLYIVAPELMPARFLFTLQMFELLLFHPYQNYAHAGHFF